MKKAFLFLSVFLILIGNVFPQTVYITKTGEKYHAEDCRYLSRSSYAIELSDAIARGYDPCSVCKPPTAITKKSQNADNEPKQAEYNAPEIKSLQSAQCSPTTQKGARCKRMTKSTNGKCWQHGGN
jgi:hypothetical protein